MLPQHVQTATPRECPLKMNACTFADTPSDLPLCGQCGLFPQHPPPPRGFQPPSRLLRVGVLIGSFCVVQHIAHLVHSATPRSAVPNVSPCALPVITFLMALSLALDEARSSTLLRTPETSLTCFLFYFYCHTTTCPSDVHHTLILATPLVIPLQLRPSQRQPITHANASRITSIYRSLRVHSSTNLYQIRRIVHAIPPIVLIAYRHHHDVANNVCRRTCLSHRLAVAKAENE